MFFYSSLVHCQQVFKRQFMVNKMAARNYPGWHEPGSTMEALINKQAFNKLPDDLQSIVLAACKAVNMDMLSEYTARNNQALNTLVNKHGVKLMPLPDDVLRKLKTLSEEVVLELANKDPMAQKIYQSFNQFRTQVAQWSALSEQAFLSAHHHP
jgi:TRAP-type mannitol/chloroaromatic compound transport system substrate-binding protein